MEIVFVRHAETAADTRGRCYGSLDVELSDRGRAQAAGLGAVFATAPVTRVLASPRVRARATAEAIAAPHALPVEIDDRLRELDFGELEGATYDQIAQTRPELYAIWMTDPTAVVFPGGEGYEDLVRRVRSALGALVTDCYLGGEVPSSPDIGALIVVVTHGGVVRAALAEVLGLPRERIFRIAVDPASVTRVRWVEGEPICLSVNHLLREDAVGGVR